MFLVWFFLPIWVLVCSNNKLTKLVLPEGFNSYLSCSSNNLTELVLPEGFNSDYSVGHKFKVLTCRQWVALERDRKINEILQD